MAGSFHVVPQEGHWAVRRAGGHRALRIFRTQKEAIDLARARAAEAEGTLYIHGSDGRIHERRTFGEDRFAPKG